MARRIARSITGFGAPGVRREWSCLLLSLIAGGRTISGTRCVRVCWLLSTSAAVMPPRDSRGAASNGSALSARMEPKPILRDLAVLGVSSSTEPLWRTYPAPDLPAQAADDVIATLTGGPCPRLEPVDLRVCAIDAGARSFTNRLFAEHFPKARSHDRPVEPALEYGEV
jgi:hypothetical protein